MLRAVLPEAGDVLLTSRAAQPTLAGWFSRLIERATRDDPSPTFSHAVLVSGPAEGIEAVFPRVRRVALRVYLHGPARWALLRPVRFKAPQRARAVTAAARRLGQWYGAGKVVLHLLDRLFRTRWFTRALGIERSPICSTLVAHCLKVGAGFYVRDDRTGRNLTVDSVAPDDLWDHARRWPEELAVVAEGDGG